MNACLLGAGFRVNADIFFSRLLTRIFRSTSSFWSSATVGLDTVPQSLCFRQIYSKTIDINKIFAENNKMIE